MKDWIAPIAVGCFALAVRAIYLSQSAAAPSFYVPVVDAESYDLLARQLASGGDLPTRLFYQGVFYPLFLTAVYQLSDASILAAKLAQIVVGAATCGLTVLVGRRLFGQRVGVAAGLVTALHGPLLFFEAELLATGWSAFWSVALLWLLLRADESRSPLRAGLFGLAGALAILTRPTFLPFIAFACGWLALRVQKRATARRQRVLWLAALGTGFALVAIPHLQQSAATTGRASLLPHSGGLNLYIGNNPDRAGTIATRPADFYRIGDLPTHNGIHDASERQRFYTDRVFSYALSDPIGFASGQLAKAIEFASPRELPRNVDVYVFRQWSGLLSTLVWKWRPWGFPNGVLFPLALLGLGCGWRTLPQPVKWFPVLYSAAIILVFVSARYRVALTPVAAILACSGVAALVAQFSAGRRLRAALMLAATLAVSLLSALPGPFAQERTDYLTELHYSVGTRLAGRAHEAREAGSVEAADEELEQAREFLLLALERDPDYAPAHANLGVIAYRSGDYVEADRRYRAALRSDPANPTALKGRVQSLRAQGRNIEASQSMQKGARILERVRLQAQ